MAILSEQQIQEIRYLYTNDFGRYVRRCFELLNPNTPLLDNWTIDCLVEYLEAVRKGDLRKLIINIPPRFLKSTIANMGFSSWLLGHNPSEKIISVSHTDSLAKTQSIQTRDIMRGRFYQTTFQTRIKEDQDTQKKFTTTEGGHRIATTIGGSITGEGADTIILDDANDLNSATSRPHMDQVIYYYSQVLYSRLNDKAKGKIINIQQRCNVNDLTGYLLEADKDFELLKLPVMFEKDRIISIGKFKKEIKAGELLHAARETHETIAKIKSTQGGMAFSGQYMQDPVPSEGAIIKDNWIKWYKRKEFKEIYQSWDLALKAGTSNDYCVGTTWGVENNQIYLVDMIRKKMAYPEQKKALISYAETWKPNQILIEDKAGGTPILQELNNDTNLPLVAINPKLDKEARLKQASVDFETGRVHFPENEGWVEDVLVELKNFPNSINDDIVDSISQFLNWRKHKTEMRIRRL